MKFQDYWTWVINGQAGAFVRLSSNLKGFYRISFLSRAGKIGLLKALESRALNQDELLGALNLSSEKLPSMQAFLNLGVTLGELKLCSGRYKLRGKLARNMAKPEFDAFLSMTEEAVGLHAPYITTALSGDVGGDDLKILSDEHSEIIARSSKIAEPILKSVLDQLIPESGPCKFLEVGSGSGIYLLHALSRNAELSATGVELVEELVNNISKKILESGNVERAKMHACNIWKLNHPGEFDCITLFNNIYYFPESDHLQLLEKLFKWLKPGGKLAIATLCRDGKFPIDAIMHMWSAMTPGASVLPEPKAFTKLMEKAGFKARAETPSRLDSAMKVFIGIRPSKSVGDDSFQQRA